MSIFDRTPSPMDAYEFAREEDGDVKLDTVFLPMSECKLIFLDKEGNPVQPGEGIPMDAHRFVVEHPSIDSLLVKDAELSMSYASAGPLVIMVTLYVATKIEQKAS